MSKYNIHSTKQDWNNLYEQVQKFPGLDLVKFKKATSFDSAAYAFIAHVAREESISFKEVTTKYPLYAYDQTITVVANQ
jgi:hypothetical protein